VIKLICKKCDQAWYTSNTRSNQKCSECGGTLIEESLITSGNKPNKNKLSIEREDKSNVMYVDW
jgi:hypothetical protein